ncbi:MAG: hypothetical protein P8L46_02900 [Acidimicrobiales bacterium]|nr:hypothetical protein [Acidimicrobiales bacterium]MDG2216976.1 hypothetical protein [Acidimicrobiales bacterium]
MRRLLALLTAFLIVASSCGSDNDGTSALEALGFSPDEAACYADAYATAGLNLSEVWNVDDLSDEDAATRDQIASDCSGDTSGSDSDSDSDALKLDELSAIERILADEMMGDGVSEDGALCMINAIQNEDIDIGELLEAGDDAEEMMGPAMMMILFSCMEELFDSESFSFDDLSDDENPDTDTYGDDPELDDLWDYCAEGDLETCDELYLISPFGSEYEDFGSSCGYTQEPTYGGCVPEATSYGDDVYLDRIHDDCAEGNLYACDELYEIAPFGSEYEAFSSSCGGLATEEQFGSCAENLGT